MCYPDQSEKSLHRLSFRREAHTQAQALGVLRGSTVAAVMAEAMETPLVLPMHAG